MVIEFPTVDIGGAPSTQGGTPDGSAAFSSLVEGLLAEEPASPEDVEADLADPNEPPQSEAAVVFFSVPPLLVSVPAPNGWAAGEASSDGLVQTADNAADSTGLHPNAIDIPVDPNAAEFGASASDVTGTESAQLPTRASLPPEPSRPVSHESASATTRPLLPFPASGSDAPALSVPGAAVPASLFPAPAAAIEGDPQVPTPAPTASAVQLVVPETGMPAAAEALQGDRSPRTDGRGHVERFVVSAADAIPADADAVQQAGSLVELGLDLGSSARDGSREGATPASSQAVVPAVLAGTAATATGVGPTPTTWMPASQADDVVLPQLVRAMRIQLAGGVGEARIQLDPEHLGAVTVNLRVEGGVVSAVVTAEQSAVRQLIENQETSLRQALAEQGLLLGKLHVERDGRSPGERRSQGQDDTPRRRSPRKDTATFELLA